MGTAFVGRSDELERLGRLLRGESDSSAIVITGDAGIGKSRLLTEALRTAPDVLVLFGACLPLSESLPYMAVTEAVSGLTRSPSRPVLERALSRCALYVRPQIAALVPALDAAPPQPSDAPGDRARLFAALRDLLGALGNARRTALVVEDLHWADPGTLDLLTFLIRGLPRGTALVATSRRQELPTGSPALDWLAAAARLPGVERLALQHLHADEVAALVGSLVDGPPKTAFVTEVVRRGEGNPFFTEQLVAAARDVAPPLHVPPGVPPDVAEMLHARVRSVSTAGTEIAAALAVAARPLAEDELAACVGKDVDVAGGIRDLLDSHLAESADLDRYRLRHALLEDTVRATLLGSQRVNLHAGVATALAARGEKFAGEVADHWARAERPAEEAHWSVAAAQHAESVAAWHEASTAWRRVWELWSSLSEPERPAVDLADVVVACVRDAGRVDLASERYDSFLDLAREALADERIKHDEYATAQLLHQYGHRLTLTDKPAAFAALEQAVTLFERAGRPSAEHAMAIRWLVLGRRLEDATTGTEDEDLARAASIAEQAGDVGALLEMEVDRAEPLFDSGHVDAALAVLAQAQARADEIGDGSGVLAVACAVTDAYIWLLRLRDGVDAGRAGIERTMRNRRLRESYGFAILVANTVDCLLLLAETQAAATLVERFRPPELTILGWPFHLARAELAILSGDFTEAIRPVDQQGALDFNNEELWLWLAEVGAAADLWSGRAKSARDRIAPVLDRVRPSPRAKRAGRMLTYAAWAAADVADGDPTVDRESLAGYLEEWAVGAECFADNPGRVLGAAYGTTFDAEIARLRRGEVLHAWRVAKDTWDSFGAPHHSAYAGWRLAQCHLELGRRKDAAEELTSAHAKAHTHIPLRGAIEHLAARARLTIQSDDRASDTPPAPVTASSRYGLTAREEQVLRLLATGATNAEIGRRLYMSPKTVSVHVTAILRKLGVSGRVQAATVAERMALREEEQHEVDIPNQ